MGKISLEQVVSEANLLQGWFKVRANNGCAGSDRINLAAFEQRLMSRLALLRDEVMYGTYRPRPLLRIWMPKKIGGMRSLSIPAIRDRVLQTALSLVLTPLFESEFEECSYAYRKGRSVQQAVKRVEILRSEGFQWVVDADIDSFFDEIDHRLLMTAVEKLVSEPGVLRLIRMWLDAEILDGDQRYFLKKGIPQGSPLSPLLANLFLDDLDEAMLNRNLRIVRFADDFLILCRTREKAEKALDFTTEVLNSLNLVINPDKTRVVDFNRGFRFLGVDFIHSLTFKTRYPDDDPVPMDLDNLARIPLEAEAKEILDARPKPQDMDSGNTMTISEAKASPGEDHHPVTSMMEIEPPSRNMEEQKVADLDPRLRTLYLLAHGSVLGKESEQFVVRRSGKIVQRIPAIKVDQIMVFGNAQISTQAMRFCLQEKIPVFLLSGQGRFFGIIDGFDTDPVLLHRDQFLKAGDQAFCLNIARQFVCGKIANCRTILLRYSRKRTLPDMQAAAESLKQILPRLDSATDLDQVRGYEGLAARTYFDALSKSLDADWQFNGRTRQPPKDPVNSLLSYGYTLLFYNLYSFIRARGLNPHVGFLHPIRSGHPALVSDLIEEFRAIVVDTVVFNLVLNRRITPECFTGPADADTPCLLDDRTRALFIQELEKKFNAPIRHPMSGDNVDYRRCFEHQANHLAAVIQGRQAQYQPMVIK